MHVRLGALGLVDRGDGGGGEDDHGDVLRYGCFAVVAGGRRGGEGAVVGGEGGAVRVVAQDGGGCDGGRGAIGVEGICDDGEGEEGLVIFLCEAD